jgi:hypothetical protein
VFFCARGRSGAAFLGQLRYGMYGGQLSATLKCEEPALTPSFVAQLQLQSLANCLRALKNGACLQRL